MSTTASSIPIVVRRADPSAQIPSDYGVTPHGTIYSTTPGGTRIIYDKKQLLTLRHSPYAQSPPAGLAFIPGVTRSSVPGITSPLQKEFVMSEPQLEEAQDDDGDYDSQEDMHRDAKDQFVHHEDELLDMELADHGQELSGAAARKHDAVFEMDM